MMHIAVGAVAYHRLVVDVTMSHTVAVVHQQVDVTIVGMTMSHTVAVVHYYTMMDATTVVAGVAGVYWWMSMNPKQIVIFNKNH